MLICLSKQSKFATIQFLVIWHVKWPWLNFKAQENLKIYFWPKIHFFLDLLARDIANHSYAPNTTLTQALNVLSNFFFLLDKKKYGGYF